MFKKTMKFDNLEGEEVTQTFYFNYNKKEIAELIEFGQILAFAKPGDTRPGLEEQLAMLSTPTDESGLSNTENNQMAYQIFQDLLLDAYGEKSADNVSFNKTPELRHYFSTHVAFVELVFEFLEHPEEAASFIEQCLPPRLVSAAKEEMQREAQGRLTSSSLSEMVEEASRRQQDPATRIEPGPEAARAALGDSPEVEKLAASIAENKSEDGQTPPRRQEDLTVEEISEMSDGEFSKLDPARFNPEQLRAAFRRKTRS